MHHFFLENFKLPYSWSQARLRYTRSAATASIVGYFVGLGDRHIQNILLDKKTAELIHIDLGVAFDQVRMSKFPNCDIYFFRLSNSPRTTSSLSLNIVCWYFFSSGKTSKNSRTCTISSNKRHC